MVHGGVEDAVPGCPGAVITGDAELWSDQALGGNAAQADDDLRLQKRNLIFQKANAGILLLGLGVPGCEAGGI